ncbi:LPXTG cell wall anchor domain-containing protein [Frigoribacterium sp. VKM Ac-2836]|uniref:LPXTG cell wall anchor domain-containing protein n=1 Tax=Frigoribacterium sp. VKM Ac-2836 TaxID=2739014 RepID=UPI001C26A763|nr:LPXTG cell wall anchor domain-containing protein [Frigoribacterium sp. VKM Ac-2836]NRD27489.1 LPXTG cell wall anchor domain-containing protein [Frigoribacterium sp. VKM Ac-2836]
MKKTVSTVTALSTAIVIALGGIALGGQAAAAAPAPAPALLDPGTSAPSEVEASPPTEPTTVVPPAPQEVVPGAAAFSVESPADGAVYPTLGYPLTIDTTEASFSYEVFDTAGRSVQAESGVTGPRATRDVHLTGDAPADQSVIVVVTGANGIVLGSETRSFRVEVPTSPAVTISSPRQGQVLPTSSTTWAGGGSFVLEGTGVAGSWLRYSFEALSGQSGWGHDYDAPVVPSDGTWAIDEALPYGSWRATVQQYVGGGDPASGGVPQLARSRPSAPVTVDFTLAPPVPAPAPAPAPAPGATPDAPVVLPVVAQAAAPTAARLVPVAQRAALASTGPAESTPWVGLAGLVLVGLGVGTILVARRRTSAG